MDITSYIWFPIVTSAWKMNFIPATSVQIYIPPYFSIEARYLEVILHFLHRIFMLEVPEQALTGWTTPRFEII